MDVRPLWALADASVGDSRSTCGHCAANGNYGSPLTVFAGARRASDLSHGIIHLLNLGSSERAVSME